MKKILELIENNISLFILIILLFTIFTSIKTCNISNDINILNKTLIETNENIKTVTKNSDAYLFTESSKKIERLDSSLSKQFLITNEEYKKEFQEFNKILKRIEISLKDK